MDAFEANLISKKKFYKDRRNFLRRIFLSLFILVLLLIFADFLYAEKKSQLKVEIITCSLLDENDLVKELISQTQGKNFFFLSSKKIGQSLLLIFPTLKDVKVRKYLFPEKKILVFASAKELWGSFFYANHSELNDLDYITDCGDLVKTFTLKKKYVPIGLLPVYSTKILSKVQFLLLKKISEYFSQNLGLIVTKFCVNDKNDLEIYTDNSIKIKAGVINESLFEKTKTLLNILDVIKDKPYLIEYIDLSLDKGAVIKKAEEKENKGKLFKFRD